jgi:hypothetical protein
MSPHDSFWMSTKGTANSSATYVKCGLENLVRGDSYPLARWT